MSDVKINPTQTGLIGRFSGEQGKPKLIEVLTESPLFRGQSEIHLIIDNSDLLPIQKGGEIIRQDAEDNDIYIIISGKFDIIANGRFVATRAPVLHVGEMALVDLTARRSATVVAVEDSLVLKIPEAQFSSFADAHPKVWRRISIELARRLRERNKFIVTPRTEPVVFIACTAESLSTARQIQTAFQYDPFIVKIWTDNIFNPSHTPIEDISAIIEQIDFGIVLITPDDKVISRDEENLAPRDNIVFELGLIIGAIGRERTFIVHQRGTDIKLPSDLLGVTPITFAPGSEDSICSRVSTACNSLRNIFTRLGSI